MTACGRRAPALPDQIVEPWVVVRCAATNREPQIFNRAVDLPDAVVGSAEQVPFDGFLHPRGTRHDDHPRVAQLHGGKTRLRVAVSVSQRTQEAAYVCDTGRGVAPDGQLRLKRDNGIDSQPPEECRQGPRPKLGPGAIENGDRVGIGGRHRIRRFRCVGLKDAYVEKMNPLEPRECG